jgi:hypothetical protein
VLVNIKNILLHLINKFKLNELKNINDKNNYETNNNIKTEEEYLKKIE